MAKGNLVKGPISTKEITDAVNSIKKLMQVLKPYEVNLTEDEKKTDTQNGRT